MSIRDSLSEDVELDAVRKTATETSRLTKSQPPVCCRPFQGLSFFLLPWYIDDREHPACPSRCCRRCDACCFHRCCGNPIVRHLLILLAAVFIFWLLWCIGVAIALSNLSPVIEMKSIDVVDPCSFDVQLVAAFDLSSDSWISGDLVEVSSTMHLSPDAAAFAKMTFSADEQTELYASGFLRSETVGLQSGSHSLDMLLHLQSLDVSTIGLFVARMMNNSITTVYVKTTATIHTSALWFPMTLSHDLVNEFTFNQPKAGPPSTPMKILAVQVDSDETILAAKNKSFAAFTWSTIFLNSSSIALRAPLPHLFVDVVHENVLIATAHVNPVYVTPIFNISLDVALDLDLTAAQTESIQHAVSFFTNGQNMTIQIRGAGSGGRSLPASSSFPIAPFPLNYTVQRNRSYFNTPLQQAGGPTCFLQAVLDAMPLVTLPITAKLPCPVPTKGTPPANSTNFTQPNPIGCLPTEWQGDSIVVSKKDSVITPTLVEAQQVIRNDTSPAYAQAYLEANLTFDFGLYGRFNPLYFDVRSSGEELGYIKIDSFSLTPGEPVWKGSVSWTTTNEPLIARKLINFKDVNALELSLQGRPNENKFSDLMLAINANITSSASDPSNNTEPSQTAVYVVVNDNPADFSLGFDLNGNLLPALDVGIPEIDVNVFSNSDNISMVQISSPRATRLKHQPEGGIYFDLLRLVCDVSMADNLGVFLKSFIDDENVSVAFKGVSAQPYPNSQTRMIVDFQIGFALNQLSPTEQNSSTTSSSTESNFGFGLEVTQLFRNDSLMTLKSLTNVSWELPISVTGTFPQLAADVKVEPPYNGSVTAQKVAGVSLSSFALFGNAASTTLDIELVDQNLAAQMVMKPTAFNVTISGSSGSDVLSRVASHFGVTFELKSDNGLGDTAQGATKKKPEATTSLYEIGFESSSSLLTTSVYLNLSASSIPINLTIPAVDISLLTRQNSTSFIEMSELVFDGAFFTSSSTTSSTSKKRLGYLQVVASHVPALGGFLNNLVNSRDVAFALQSNGSSAVNFDFQLDRFNLKEFLDFVAVPEPGGWLSLPQLLCSDTGLSQSEWDYNKHGDQWIVNCPAACAGGVTVLRPGVYAATSSICAAAKLEGALSSCGGKVLVTIEDPNSFSIDAYVSRSLWPLLSVEPLDVSRNEDMFHASAGLMLASFGVPLTGSIPNLELAIARTSNVTEVLLRAQVNGFVLPPTPADLGLTVSATVYEQQPLIDVVSDAKEQGANLTISGMPGSHVINSIASYISYELAVPPTNTSKPASLFESMWPPITVDVDSNTSTATVRVSTRFTPDFNLGFDVNVGALKMDVSIGQLIGYPDGWTLAGGFSLDEIKLKDNACSNLSATVVLSTPSLQPSFLTSVMRQFFHGYVLNSSFQGTIAASGSFGVRTLSINASLPSPVSARPPAETDGRCLCEPVWEDQGQFFYGECANTATHPNGWCKIQNGSCFGTPASPTWDSCTQQITRTYYGCECLNPWSYGTKQYTDGGCHNPDDSPQPWCLVKPGSCFGDDFTSAYDSTVNMGQSNATYKCGTFYSQAMTEAACDDDPACYGYNYAPSAPSSWCLTSANTTLTSMPGVDFYKKGTQRAVYRERDICTNPTLVQAQSSVLLNSAHLLGSGSGNRVVLPCVLPGTFCPYESTGLNATGIEVMLNLSLVALPFPLQVNLHSNLDIVLQGYGLSPLVSIKVRALNFSSDKSMGLVVLVTPLDLPLIQTVVKDITHGKNNVDIGIAGATGPEVGLLSSMFARVGQKVTFFKYAVDEDGYIVDEDKAYNFSYWISDTTEDSATVSVTTPLNNPVNITWDLGQVDIKAWYKLQSGTKPPVVVAVSSFPFSLSPGLNQMYISASLVSEPVLNVCQGYPQVVSPQTFCAANEIVSLVLSKTTYSGIPLTLEISTTNIFGQTIVVEVNLALMSFDSSPTRGKTLTPSNLYIMDGYSFEYMSSAWSSLTSATLTIDMTVRLFNPFNVTLTATDLALSLYMKDWEGGQIENSIVRYALGEQTVPPEDNLFLLSHHYSNPAGVTVSYNHTTDVLVEGIQIKNMTSNLTVHLYDNFMEKSRMCVHVTDGSMKFSVKGASSSIPLMVTQFFSRRDISAVGWSACEGPPTCVNSQVISSWTPATWANLMAINAGTAETQFESGSLRITRKNTNEYGSAFMGDKVLLAGNWETSFDMYWDYGTFGVSEGLSMIFHDQPSGKQFIINGKYGYLNSGLRGFAIVFVADHMPGCATNCEENMKIVRDGVEVTSGPGSKDPLRTQFVWGSNKWEKLTVRYNYDTKYMYIYYGSQLQLVWTVDFITSGFADANGMGWVGFGARTANVYAGEFRVNNWQWDQYKVSQDNVRINGGNGLVVGYAGPQESTFVLDTRDSCNFAVYSNMLSNPPLLVRFTGQTGSPSAGINVDATSVEPVAASPGLLRVTAFLTTEGIYDVHVKCNDGACSGNATSYSLIGNVKISPSY